jgi:putative redox protein
VILSGERRAEHPRAFTRIEILHRVTGHDVSQAALEDAIRLSDTKYCSVHAMLEPHVEIVSRYEILPA